jgi:uncharacterized protein YeaO (DUF488 family)
MILLKRAYDPPAPSDGTRILVDRLWPRGVSRESAHIHRWEKDWAPSSALRLWYGHDPERFAEFRRRYRRELERRRDSFGAILSEARVGTVTLVFGARDAAHSNASVLKEFLDGGGSIVPDRRRRKRR